MHWKQLDFLL